MVRVLAITLLTACQGSLPQLELLGVEPPIATFGSETVLTIHGRGFHPVVRGNLTEPRRAEVDPEFTITLRHATRDVVLAGELVTSTELRATLPAVAPPGAYELAVEDPHGRSATLRGGFEIESAVMAPPCTDDSECAADPCATTGRCVDERCLYDKDSDGDGHVDAACGGEDCDDDPAACGDRCIPQNPTPDTCDGADADCDGATDEDHVLSATTCGTGACSGNTGQIACQAGELVDTCDPWAGATADDATCDGTDDDCDGVRDEDYVPAATICGTGACAGNAGELVCQAGELIDTCDPWAGAAADDATCDGTDDDCDGAYDEDYTPVATACGDGVCANAGELQCTGGAAVDTCTPGLPTENPEASCDDLLDNDCDGATDAADDDCGPLLDCTGAPDLALCQVTTVPDRDYDICLGEQCISPGCGDASCNSPGPAFPIADTSQRTCFDDNGAIDCAALPDPSDPSCAGTSHCGQDAQVGWDTAHAPDERFTRTEPAPGEPVVFDEVTTLAWIGCSIGQSGDATTCTGTPTALTWEDALADCDGLSWGGATDWRLPDPWELQSITDADATGVTVDTAAFPGTSAALYWASSTRVSTTAEAWIVSFLTGYANRDEGKGTGKPVRCVRGPATRMVATPRFERTEPMAGNPVVVDHVTGLTWQGCALGQTGGASTCSGGGSTYRWRDALSACLDLDWGGFDDWSLPSASELFSIQSHHHEDPAIDTVAFPGTPREKHWTSTTRSTQTNQAFRVRFDVCNLFYENKTTALHVRCVRGR